MPGPAVLKRYDSLSGFLLRVSIKRRKFRHLTPQGRVLPNVDTVTL